MGTRVRELCGRGGELPVIRQEFFQPVGGVVADGGNHVAQVGGNGPGDCTWPWRRSWRRVSLDRDLGHVVEGVWVRLEDGTVGDQHPVRIAPARGAGLLLGLGRDLAARVEAGEAADLAGTSKSRTGRHWPASSDPEGYDLVYVNACPDVADLAALGLDDPFAGKRPVNLSITHNWGLRRGW